MDILNRHRSAQGTKANSQVKMAPVQFDQCATSEFVCKNRTESIHQQTLRKKQPLGPDNIQVSMFTWVKQGLKSRNALLQRLRSVQSTKFVILEKRLGQQKHDIYEMRKLYKYRSTI